METFKYLGKEYYIVKKTKDYTEIKNKDWDEVTLQVRVGTPRYCDMFGGEPVNISSDIPDSVLVKPKVELMCSSKENSIYGNGFIVNTVDKLCDIYNKSIKEKSDFINSQFENYPEKSNGLNLMLLCAYYRKKAKIYSSDITELLREKELGDGSYLDMDWDVVLNNFQETFIDNQPSKDDIQTLFSMIECEDRKFFKYALAGWEGMMKLPLTNNDIENILQ